MEAHVTLSPNPSPRERGWRQKPPFVASLLIAPPQAGRDAAKRNPGGRGKLILPVNQAHDDLDHCIHLLRVTLCKEAGLPEPEYDFVPNFVCLTIRFKNPLTPYLSGDENGGVNDGVKTLSESLKPVYSTVFFPHEPLASHNHTPLRE